MTLRPYPELFVADGNVDGLYRIETKSGYVVIQGHFESRKAAERLVDCWNAVRHWDFPLAAVPAIEDRCERLEGLRKEAWARVQELESLQ